VSLLAFSSGLPLGIVLFTIPYWMKLEGIDIKTIGLVGLAQIPYAFKFVWSPLMDRWAPSRRWRAWIAIAQALLAAVLVAFAASSGTPTVLVVGLLAVLLCFASATQDIAVDAYSVEVLRKEELEVGGGARQALYRLAMFMGRIANTAGPLLGWRPTFAIAAGLFAPLAVVTARAPAPEAAPPPPRTLRQAVWEPFVGFFRHARALEIAAFLFFYKFADNLAGALVSPFLDDLGYDSWDVGVAVGLTGVIAGALGTLLGGVLSAPLGLGRALWVFGLLQAISNLGYFAVAEAGVNRPVMYAATAFESLTSGMGTGAFGVFLLRLTQKRFSATQFALFSSIFALGRTFASPPAGALVDAIGWRDFFPLTIAFAIPGLLLLQRFVPWRSRDIPEMVDRDEAPPAHGAPVGAAGLAARGLAGAAIGTVVSYALNLLLVALRMARGAAAFDLAAAWRTMLNPTRPVDWLDLVGPPVAGVVVGLAVAAYVAARRGVVWGRVPAVRA
jgi:PAT family beta-lactamase induction signal transducer AmpG